MNIFLWDNIFR